MNDVEFENVHKTYKPGLLKKPVKAVKGLSLEVPRGEVFGLVGPNGAGKSTAIRLLLGLISPDSGSIRFKGDLLKDASIQKHIGYLPENPYLYDHLSLTELLRFCGSASGLSSTQTTSRTAELVALLGLKGAEIRPLRTFSKGMLQRAAICFALLHDPSMVILDEPMSGLDPLGRKMVFELVQQLKGEGKTIFFCSHILSDVERLCDRIGIMVGGRLLRVLGKDEYADVPEYSVHLLLSPLDAVKKGRLSELPCTLTFTAEGPILSAGASSLGMIMAILQKLDVEVRATRTARFSLEELFMTLVQEHQS